MLIYLRQVSADELTAEESLLPDVVLYRPGDIPDPDGLFLPISGDAPIFAGLLSGGRQVAYPLCWGAWVLAVDSAYDPQTAATPAPTTLLGRPSSTLSPEQTPALFPLEKADAANCPLLSPGGCALYALREIFANQAYPRWTDDFAQLPSDAVYQRFRARKCASAMLTTGQVVAFSGLTSAGKGFPFRVMVGQTVTTEQVLLSSICAGAQDGAADLLSFLVSRGAQEQLVHQGLFSVREDLALYPSGWAAEVEQAARRGDRHAGCVPVGRGFAAKSMAGLSVIVLPVFIQLPSASRYFPRAAPPEFCRRGSRLPRPPRHHRHYHPHSRD